MDKKTLAKMRIGICPVCNCKMKKHSKNKLIVCKNLFKQRFGLPPTKVVIDGKEYEVELSLGNQNESDKKNQNR